MADYIDREAALRTAHIMRPEDKCLETELMKIPAADVAPVVHGRWIDNGIPGSMLSGCSVCGFTCGAYSFFTAPTVAREWTVTRCKDCKYSCRISNSRYCAHCNYPFADCEVGDNFYCAYGARMDGDA